jgi:predicted ester cyclase
MTETTTTPGHDTAAENKAVVARLIDEVLNGGRLDLIGELLPPEAAVAARQWIEPFRAAFPDVEMRTVELLSEGDRVAGHFRCPGTHLGRWRGHEPTGRAFQDVEEVYFFTVKEGRIVDAWGLEDTVRRQEQLGL